MVLVYHLSGIVWEGRLQATFLLHDIEHDQSFTIDTSFDANLPEGPWEFTVMAAAGDLLCVRGRSPQRDVLMLFSPQQRAWKRLPPCTMVKRFKRVGMSFCKDDHSYKVLAVQLNGDTVVTEVFDSKLEAWGTITQQKKEFRKLLGRCEFDHENQEFYHLIVVKEEDEERVYSMIRYKKPSRGWRLVDMKLPVRMSDYSCTNDHHEGYEDRDTNRWVNKASLVGNGNSLKLMVVTQTTSSEITYDFEQDDSLVYEYDKVAGKWRTIFLCSFTSGQSLWKEKANNRKYRWFKEGSRWYPAVIGTNGKQNALKVDDHHPSDSESDIGSGKHVVPPLLVPKVPDAYRGKHGKRLPRRKLPRGGGDIRMKPSEEACTLMLESLGGCSCKIFGHGNKVFMASEGETRLVMFDCINREFSVLHLSEPCVLRKEGDDVNYISQFANWDPVCVDLELNNSNVSKRHRLSDQEKQYLERIFDSDNKLMGGNGLLVYDMTSMVTGNGELIVNLIVHDVVVNKSGVINLIYDAGLQDIIWEVKIVAAAGCLICFRCRHTVHGDVYLVCKPACNLWQLLPPIAMQSKFKEACPVVGMHVDDSQASYKVLVSTFDKTVVFDSKVCGWTSTDHGKGEWIIGGCRFDTVFGGFLSVIDRNRSRPCIAIYAVKKWERIGIRLPNINSHWQLFGSHDRTMLLDPGHRTGRCAVYGVNTRESKLEPILLNREFLKDDVDLTGATILEELEESEARELVLRATECFGRGDCIFWAKREDERVVMYDCVSKQFKVLHIVKPWSVHDDGHRRLRYNGAMKSGYVHSVYLCMP